MGPVIHACNSSIAVVSPFHRAQHPLQEPRHNLVVAEFLHILEIVPPPPAPYDQPEKVRMQEPAEANLQWPSPAHHHSAPHLLAAGYSGFSEYSRPVSAKHSPFSTPPVPKKMKERKKSLARGRVDDIIFMGGYSSPIERGG